MYSKTDLGDLESRTVEGIEPRLKAVGYELRPGEMRPSVWEFSEGETNNCHRHDAQEELYYALEGSFVVTVERGDDRETFDLTAGEFAVVPPETWRQFEALEESRLLAVGAPNVKDDAVVDEEAAE